MKKARKSRSKSPSKRVRFKGGRSAAVREVLVPPPASLAGYVQCVRHALSGRADDYREFVHIIADLRRTVATSDDNDTTTQTIISQVERAVSLLDGQPELIDGLRIFLPSQYHIDVQPDAVVIKVRISNSVCLSLGY